MRSVMRRLLRFRSTVNGTLGSLVLLSGLRRIGHGLLVKPPLSGPKGFRDAYGDVGDPTFLDFGCPSANRGIGSQNAPTSLGTLSHGHQ